MRSTLEAILTGLVIGAGYWFAIEARWAKPETNKGYTEYPLPKGLKFLVSASVSVFLYGAISNLLRPGRETWVSVLLMAQALFCLYFTPATIFCSRERLVSVRWYGIKRVSMNWADVVSVYKDPADNSLTVTDKFNHRIVHTMFNVGRAEFLREISELPYNFARML